MNPPDYICFWPEAAPHQMVSERPLLVKADAQNCRYRGTIISNLDNNPPRGGFARIYFKFRA